VSYFDILKADPSVSLDTNELESNFRNLQRLLHPDKFSTRSEKERELSAENSALVNVAYQTLKKPLSRVRYILSSQGIDALSESSGTAGVDPALLMEIMELRESLEEGGKSAAELDRMTAEAQSHIDATLKALECCLAAKDTEGLAKQAIRLQYYSKLDEEIEVVRDKAPQTAASCMV
jgi:molecular chaperone HscB